MKIALNGTFWNQPTTGSGQYLRALLPALRRRGPQNEYVLIMPRAGGNLAKLWFEQIAFASACRSERAALAHVPYFASPYFLPTRTVVTIHDLIPLLLPAYRGSLLVRAYSRLVAASARRADAIIADSKCTKRDIVQHLGIAAARVHVVHLAVDGRYRPIGDPAAICAKYSLPEKYLLYLGGFDQRKNVRTIIEAFARLPDLHAAGYRLVLAGVKLGADPEFFPNPQRIAREAGLPDTAIQYIGWVDEDDKPALYAGAAAFLFPSLYEGFGLPPLEAMACGTAVISSNASSLPEVLGDGGMLIDPRNVEAWADAIHAVLNDGAGRTAIRERGIAQSEKFSWDRAAEQTLAAYERAVT